MSDHSTDPADVLEQAADLLETQGWCRGEYKSADGTHCAVGAIRAVTGVDAYFIELIDEFTPKTDELRRNHRTAFNLAVMSESAFANNLDMPYRSHGYTTRADRIVIWNDKPERTADQVIDLMKHTAKDLRNRKEVA